MPQTGLPWRCLAPQAVPPERVCARPILASPTFCGGTQSVTNTESPRSALGPASAHRMFLTCGWSARMPVSNTPMRTRAPRNPAAHSFSAPNSAVTLLRACSTRRATKVLSKSQLAVQTDKASMQGVLPLEASYLVVGCAQGYYCLTAPSAA